MNVERPATVGLQPAGDDALLAVGRRCRTESVDGGLRWFDCNARIGPWSNPQPEQFTDIDGLLAAWDRVGIEAGPGDFTPSYHFDRPEVRCSHRLALPILFFSPIQHLFWHMPPGKLRAQKLSELKLWKGLPTVWDDTVGLHGAIGECVSLARRSGRTSDRTTARPTAHRWAAPSDPE
mgnify:CR=1 FL=1